MQIIIQLVVSALVIFTVANRSKDVQVASFAWAFIVALVLGLLNFFVGWIFVRLLNMATLGIFYFTGLTFLVRLVVSGVFIELIDQFTDKFNTKGILPSLYLAVLLAIASTVVGYIF